MTRWFRFYDEVVDDPKVQRLPAALFKFWVNSMCLASKNGGDMPALVDMAFRLRMTEKQVSTSLRALVDAALVDQLDGVSTPHNWNVRQFKSDVSTDRVKRFRERTKERDETVSGNAPESEQSQSRAETEQIDTPPAAPAVVAVEGDFKLEPEIPAFLLQPKPAKQPVKLAIPDWVPREQWLAFVDMRKKIKAPLTDHAAKLAIGELDKLRAQGHAPGAVLDNCILKNYRGIFPPPANTSTPNTTIAAVGVPANLEAVQAEEAEFVRKKREQANVH